jgi:hypothetical protein
MISSTLVGGKIKQRNGLEKAALQPLAKRARAA